MDIFFCLSYLSIPHTISLIQEKQTDDFLIVVSNASLQTFFTKLYSNEKTLFIDKSKAISTVIPKKKGLIKFPVTFLKLLYYKRKIWKLFANYESANVYFFFNAYAYFFAWLIYRLSKKNRIYYCEDYNFLEKKPHKSFEASLNKGFIKLFYKEEVIPLDIRGGYIAYRISDLFLTKIKANIIDIPISYRKLSDYVSNELKIESGDVLLLTGFVLELGTMSENEYINKTDDLISSLSTRYKVHLKSHPRYSKKYSKENDLFEVPKFVPSTLLLNYKIVIGYNSSTLFAAANNGNLAISLLHYYESSDANKVQYGKNSLLNNLDSPDKKIYFPSNIEEIYQIIDEHINESDT